MCVCDPQSPGEDHPHGEMFGEDHPQEVQLVGGVPCTGDVVGLA